MGPIAGKNVDICKEVTGNRDGLNRTTSHPVSGPKSLPNNAALFGM